MGQKYIRNTDDATIVCKIPSDKNKVFIFKPRKIDKRNNILMSNGFTEVSAEDLELLKKESSTFNYYFDNGRLSLTDDLPEEAMSPEQLINMLKSENKLLKAQLAEGDSADALTEAQKALQNALAEIEAKEKELQVASEKIEEQSKMIEALDQQLATMSEELHAASAAPKAENE